MSGDLKDPGRSIPRGTLAAVGVGFLVYCAQIIIFGGAFERQALITAPYKLLHDNAIFGWSLLVTMGVVAATLSSALGSDVRYLNLLDPNNVNMVARVQEVLVFTIVAMILAVIFSLLGIRAGEVMLAEEAAPAVIEPE